MQSNDRGGPAGRPGPDADPGESTTWRPPPTVGQSTPVPPDGEQATVLRPRPAAPDQGEATTLRATGAGAPLGYSGPGWQPDQAEQSTTLRPPDGAAWGGGHASPRTLPPVTQAAEVPTYPQLSSRRYELPQDHFEAPPEVRQRVRRALPVRALVTWALVVVLVGVVAGVVYVRVIRKPAADPNVSLPSASVTASVTITKPDEVVRRYLTALSTNDVAGALALGDSASTGSRALLTSAAYSASLAAAPITDITVPAVESTVTDIPAQYKLGDQDVKTSFKVAKQDDGSYRMVKTTVTYRFRATNAGTVPLLVNGVKVELDNLVQLLPGRYTPSTGLPFLGYDSTSTLTVLHLNYPDLNVQPIVPTLTSQGQQALLDAGKASLADCLAKKELSPANCPMSVGSARPVVPDSIRWRQVGDQWTKAAPGLSANDQSTGEINLNLNLTIEASYGGSAQLDPQPYRGNVTVSASLLVSTAAELKPRWRIN